MANPFIYPKIHALSRKKDKSVKRNKHWKIEFLQKYGESYVHLDQPIFSVKLMCKEVQYHLYHILLCHCNYLKKKKKEL